MDTTTPADVRVAFIGGHGRSGSTLLARMLGAVDGVFSAGEVCYIWEQGVLRDRICSCEKPFSQCEFWQHVGEVAFGGWTTEVAERGLALRKQVDRNRYVHKLAAPQAFPEFRDKLAEYSAMYGRVLLGIRAASGAEVVVDTSKNPSTGYLLRQVPEVDLRVVHLVRDVHGVAWSWAKLVARKDRDGAPMPQLSYARTAREWTAFNAMVEGLGVLGQDRTLLRYEDLISSPGPSLERILEFVGRPVPADALDFLDGHEVTLPRGHEVTGNPMRFKDGPQPLALDEEWRRAMPAFARRAISVGTAPALLRYGYAGSPGHARGAAAEAVR